MNGYGTVICTAALLLVSWSDALAQTDAGTLRQEDVAYDKPDYSPFVDRHVSDRVFWGDTHLHTSFSVDAGFFGNTLAPEDAYRFARGEEVVSSTGVRVKLIRPLDFVVVCRPRGVLRVSGFAVIGRSGHSL